MCNRFRSIKEWSDIPRRFHSGPRLNFEFNPNVAPTELVLALVAGEDLVLARFGINRLGSADKPRPPLLNVRTDGMRKGQFRKHLKGSRGCGGLRERPVIRPSRFFTGDIVRSAASKCRAS
jgi:putative SOS response-associated peptidase YedK